MGSAQHVCLKSVVASTVASGPVHACNEDLAFHRDARWTGSGSRKRYAPGDDTSRLTRIGRNLTARPRPVGQGSFG